MESLSSVFMSIAKVAFLVGLVLGCLALALQGLAKLLLWLGGNMQQSAGSKRLPNAPKSTPEAVTEVDELELED